MILLPNCACCCKPCCRTVLYSYADTDPPAPWYDSCPTIGGCGENAPVGSCAGQVLEGHILERFCKVVVGDSEIRAKLLDGSTLDDYGVIAGVSTDVSCGRLGVIIGDHDITDDIEIITDPDDDGYWLAKVPFAATNAQVGGPYGVAQVRICWCCKDPESEEECECCATPPPPPPPPCFPPCEDGQECCDGVCQEGPCENPCDSCDDCGFSGSQFEQGGAIECFGFGTQNSTRAQDVYLGLPPGGMPAGVTWKDGYPSALDECQWAFIVDSLSIDCCYEGCIINGVEGNTFGSKTRNRYRVILLTCPDGPGSEQVTDITSLAIQGELEFETDNKPAACPGPPVACTAWFDYFPDPDPVCNPLP